MTKLALFGDVHSNLFALEAVLSDAKKNEVLLENIIFTGDMIGYGNQPLECLSIVGYLTGAFPSIEDNLLKMIPKSYRTSPANAKAFNGNHEIALLMKMQNPRINLGGYGISEKAGKAIDETIAAIANELTRTEVKGFLKSLLPGKDKPEINYFQFLQSLPTFLTVSLDGINAYIAHSNPLDSEDRSSYVMHKELAEEVGKESYITPAEILSSPKMADFQLISVSHTHIPAIYVGNNSGVFRIYENVLNLRDIRKSDTKIMINTGSAGMPRTEDKRPCYPIIDTANPRFIQIQRVA